MSEEPEEAYEEMDPDVARQVEAEPALTPQDAAGLAIPEELNPPRFKDRTYVGFDHAVGANAAARSAKLSKPWNKAETGTEITTDPNEDGQLVDDARFDALEKGGFFGERDAKEIMGELHAVNIGNPPATAKADWSAPPNDITGDPVKMGEPRPPTESEIAYGQDLEAGLRKTVRQRKSIPPPVSEEDGA